MSEAGELDNDLFFPQFVDAREENRVRIDRADDLTKKWTYHGYLLTREASEAKVNELFGGGSYWARYSERGPNGSFRFLKHKFVTIPGRYRPPLMLPTTELTATGPSSPAPTAPTPAGPETPAKMSLNEVLQTTLVTQVLDVVKANKASPATDWGVVLTAILPAAVKVVERIVDRPREGPDHALAAELASLRDQINRLSQPQPSPAASNLGEAFKMMRDMLAVQEELGSMGRGSGPASADDKLLEVGGRILEAMTTSPSGRPAGARPQPIPPGGQPVLALWQQMLLRYRPILVGEAMKGTPTNDVVELALRFMPAEAEGVLREFVARPDAQAALRTTIPELQQFPVWSDMLVISFRQAIEAMDKDEPEEEEAE